jgi:hypothetical protein
MASQESFNSKAKMGEEQSMRHCTSWFEKNYKVMVTTQYGTEIQMGKLMENNRKIHEWIHTYIVN